jgi:dTMP kinase
MGRGALIVFEGADRSGKTTQTVKCVAALRAAGVPVACSAPWRFPDRTTAVGKMINAYLSNAAEMNDQALHLLFSANRWEKSEAIQNALDVGETVVLDRYVFSGAAYSAAKGLDVEWCKACDVGLPTPDVVIYLDLALEVAAMRGQFGEERYENEAMQRAVASQFAAFKTLEFWRTVDADATEEAVFDRVMNVIMPVVADIRTSSRANGKLWS